MSNNNNIPWGKIEISIRRFNDSAIPHHLQLLQNHRSNIERCLSVGDWTKLKKEEINALRVIKQLKNLVMEMDSLRLKVPEDDLDRFDDMMNIGKQKAFGAMKEYLELNLKTPELPLQSQQIEDLDDLAEPVNIKSTPAHQRTVPNIESDFEKEPHQMSQRQACLVELENLQYEIRDLNSMFHNMHNMINEQRDCINVIADNAEEALEEVREGESYLKRALTYKKAMYPMMGALIGTCMGGPIGLVAGIKAGGLAAVGCGVLGFTGGAILKSSPSITGREMEVSTLDEGLQDVEQLEDKNV